MHIDRRHAPYPRERSVGGDEPVMHRRAWDRYAGKVHSSSQMRSRVVLLRDWAASWDRHEDFLHLARGIIEGLYLARETYNNDKI